MAVLKALQSLLVFLAAVCVCLIEYLDHRIKQQHATQLIDPLYILGCSNIRGTREVSPVELDRFGSYQTSLSKGFMSLDQDFVGI